MRSDRGISGNHIPGSEGLGKSAIPASQLWAAWNTEVARQAYFFTYDNAYWDRPTSIDVGSAFKWRAELRKRLAFLDTNVFLSFWEADPYDSTNSANGGHPVQPRELATKSRLLLPVSRRSAECPTIVFGVDDFGSLRYAPLEASPFKQRPGHSHAASFASYDIISGSFVDGAAAKWVTAVLATLIGCLSNVIALILRASKAVGFFRVLILIEREWFLYHGSHPPKTQGQVDGGLSPSGLCSSPLAA